ncbi:MAG: phospholipase D-like domain-containing protein [Cyanobacteria bacterium J06641_5]
MSSPFSVVPKRWACWVTIIFTVIIAGLLLESCRTGSDGFDELVTIPDPLPQDPQVEVFFNYNQAKRYSDPYRQIERPGDNLEAEIIRAIASAARSIEVAVQEFRLPEVAHALVERQQAGVEVRVVIENTYSRPWSTVTPAEAAELDARDRGQYEEAQALLDVDSNGTVTAAEIAQRDALVILQAAGVPLLDDTADGSKGSGLMHHKFLVVDGETVLVTSANFTTSGIHGDFANPNSRGNANNLLKIHSPELAGYFRDEFALLWGDGPGSTIDSRFGTQKPSRAPVKIPVGDGAIALHFSPNSPTEPWEASSNGAIARALDTATESIDLALFVFSEQRLADAIEARAQVGTVVRALIDPGFAYRYYSEGLDLLGVAVARNCEFEAENNPWAKPITEVGVPALARGDKLHHKFALIDDRRIVTGSHNWSPSANYQNDETVLIVDNLTVARHFRREFDRLYTSAATGVPSRVTEKIVAQETDCAQLTTRGEQPTGPLDLNRASVAELETLPGIGPELAERIAITRQERPFTSLEDLQRVSGIGPNKAEALQGLVSW